MAVDVVAPQPTQRRGIASFFPILAWLPRYDPSWLRLDIIAGITVVALLVPEGMAYAELAGMPPQTIFYAARLRHEVSLRHQPRPGAHRPGRG